jgi:acyl-coenzyme A synthetase/AMP-(fatty) acid ligase
MAPRLLQRLDELAARRPDAPAVCETAAPEAALTFGAWRAAAGQWGQALRRESTPPGPVLIAIGNRPAFHVAFTGALLAGRDVLPVSPEATPAELAQLIEQVRAGVIVGPHAVLEHAPAALAGYPEPEWESPSTASHDIDVAWQTPPTEGALLLATSGTTAEPRVVHRPAHTLDAVAWSCVSAIGFHETDRVLLPVPVHHSYGLEHGLLAPLAAGATVELVDQFDLQHLARRLIDAPVTILPAAPFVFEALPDALETANHARSELALRRAYSAGAPLPVQVAERCHSALGVGIGQVYGATEIGSVAFNDPDIPPFDPTSVGRAMPGMALRVLDPHQRDPTTPRPTGEEGEVAVQAPSMLDAFVGRTESPTRGGFYLTGDLGRLDEHGRLTISGRVKLLIEVGGQKVNPLEVEQVLLQHHAVNEAAVVPAPVTATVNRLKAVVVVNDPQAFDSAELRRFVRQYLRPYKVPRLIETRPGLPRTSAGKIQRRALECGQP